MGEYQAGFTERVVHTILFKTKLVLLVCMSRYVNVTRLITIGSTVSTANYKRFFRPHKNFISIELTTLLNEELLYHKTVVRTCEF